MKVTVNGKPDAQVDARDRGLQYGDGVFETMAVRNGVIYDFDAHFERLQRGCSALLMPTPDKSGLLDEISTLLEREHAEPDAKAIIKLVITRGVSKRGYAPPEMPECNRILYLSSWPKDPDKQASHGVSLMVCRTRLGLNPALAGIKHLNRLEQVLGSQELAGTRFYEGIMLDVRDQVVEGTRSNIFIVENKRMITPAIDQCGVAGIARERIIQMARDHDMSVEIEAVRRDRLDSCDEMFLCNSIIGIVPVSFVAGRKIAIGPMTRRLQKLLQSESMQ